MTELHIGDIFRYPKPIKRLPERIDGLPNFFAITHRPDHKKVTIERGISNPSAIRLKNGAERIPVIAIRSSPHKAGSEDTPWQDVFDVDRGYIRYFGDNKTQGEDPANSRGNKILLHQFKCHHTASNKTMRIASCPLVYFRTSNHNGKTKGFVEFMGFGIIESIEIVTQYAQHSGQYFTNYCFGFAALDLSNENESFDWQWIIDRSNQSLSDEETLQHAPKSWIDWTKNGESALSTARRNVTRLHTLSPSARRPTGTDLKDLITIYDHFSDNKFAFELLALRCVGSILNQQGGQFEEGWISKQGGDRGIDFVGRLQFGSGFGSTRIAVLGQAKCVKPDSTTPGLHLSRTVSRLRRGWIGAFVTTNTFSLSAQEEVIDDKYPLLLVDGMSLLTETRKLANENGCKKIKSYLDSIVQEYPRRIRDALPEEILSSTGRPLHESHSP